MRRALCVVGGCLLVVWLGVERDSPPLERTAAASPADFVVLEHRLVNVEVRSDRVAPPRSGHKPRAVTRPATARRPLFARAKQFVLGDGYFRPEPFPRPGAR